MCQKILTRCVAVAVALLLVANVAFADDEVEGSAAAEVRNDERLPLPSAAELKRAAQTARLLYQDLIERSDRDGRLEVARTMFKRAWVTQDQPAMQYHLFHNARRLAASAGDGRLAFDIVEQLDQRFQIDKLDVLKHTLRVTVLSLHAKRDTEDAVKAAIATAEDYARAEKYDDADDLLTMLLVVVRATKDPGLHRWVSHERDRNKLRSSLFNAADRANEELEKYPTNPVANLALGRYLCFVQNNWAAGSRAFLYSDDYDLAEVAAWEAAAPHWEATSAADYEEQFDLAEEWWELAGQRQTSSTFKTLYLARAAHWYEKALPGLDDVHRELAEKRLEQIEKDGQQQGREQ